MMYNLNESFVDTLHPVMEEDCDITKIFHMIVFRFEHTSV